jgi:cytochrome b
VLYEIYIISPNIAFEEDMIVNQEIRVWDLLVRIFHWSLVVGFAISYLTGEEENDLHIYAGYAVLGLITFRVLWGFIGTRHARFSDFVFSPAVVAQYLKGLVYNKPKRYIGHNPAGGWMVVVMLICLFVVTVSGLKVYAIEEGLGPLADETSELAIIRSAYADDGNDEEAEEFWEEIHEASSNIMLLLIFLHIAGVIVSSRLHKENLVKSMFTGKKTAGR